MSPLELAAVERKLQTAKEQLTRVYEQKGRTDPEVLLLAVRVDRLLNIYDRMTQKPGEERAV